MGSEAASSTSRLHSPRLDDGSATLPSRQHGLRSGISARITPPLQPPLLYASTTDGYNMHSHHVQAPARLTISEVFAQGGCVTGTPISFWGSSTGSGGKRPCDGNTTMGVPDHLGVKLSVLSACAFQPNISDSHSFLCIAHPACTDSTMRGDGEMCDY